MKTPNFKTKSKVLGVAVLLVMLAIMPFIAMPIPTAKANFNESLYISLAEGTTSNFVRYKCDVGYHDNTYYDIATVTSQFHTEQIGLLTFCHAHLKRTVTFTGTNNDGYTSGAKSIQDYTTYVTGGIGTEITAQWTDNLNLLGLNWDAAFLPDSWEGYLVEVSYQVFWYWGDENGFDGYTNWVGANHDERYSTTNWNWDPLCAPSWASGGYGETYNGGVASSVNYAVGSYKPDGYAAYIGSSTTGGYGRVVLTLNEASLCAIQIKGTSSQSSSHVITYARHESSQTWYQISDQYISYSATDHWINLGDPAWVYDAIIICAYKAAGDGNSGLYIDCLQTPYMGYF